MKIGLIGAGNMGEAIIAGVHKNHRLAICEMSFRRRAYIKSKYRAAFTDIEGLIAHSDIIVLAVKPQDLGKILEQMAEFDVQHVVFLSIAAGITSRYIEKALDQDVAVIRSMPNMPAMINEGVTGIARGRFATRKDLALAIEIMEQVGDVVTVEEKFIDAITAVSGSGPAYVFYFVECMTKAAQSLGLNQVQANELVMSTLLGSVHLLKESKDSAEVLRKKVTSKGGTTEAALNVLIKKRFDKILTDALTAAKNRAKELSK